MKKINSDLFRLKDSNPNEFWGIIFSVIFEECESDSFRIALDGLLQVVKSKFRSHFTKNVKFPYGCWERLLVNESDFLYFVYVFAGSEETIESPEIRIVGVLPFPDNYYSFIISNNREIDVLIPHLMDKYARRSCRNTGEIIMPNTFYHPNLNSVRDDEKEKMLNKLFRLLGKFMFNNMINFFGDSKDVYSFDEQQKRANSSNWPYCLWMDGMTFYDTVFQNGDKEVVRLHRTYLPYFPDSSVADDFSFVKDNQLKVISSHLEILFKNASTRYPTLYNYIGINPLVYSLIHREIGNVIESVYPIFVRSNKLLRSFEKEGFISIDENLKQPPKKRYKEVNAAEKVLDTFCESTIQNEDLDYKAEVAEALLTIISRVYWLMEESKTWYRDSGKIQCLKEGTVTKSLRLMYGISLKERIQDEVVFLKKVIEKTKDTFDVS